MGKRIKRSDRYLIDANGDEVETTELATGVGYCLVNADGSEVQAFEEQMKNGVIANPDGTYSVAPMVLFHAFMGFQTKNGNVANTVLNDKADPGTLQDAALAVTEHLENVRKGIWIEKDTAVARGPKYDKDILAGAIFYTLKNSKDAAGNPIDKTKGDLASYRLRLDTDKAYGPKVRAITAIMAQYYKDLEAHKANGSATPAADALDSVS